MTENRRTMGPQDSCGAIVGWLEGPQDSCGQKTARFYDELTIYRPLLAGEGSAGILRPFCSIFLGVYRLEAAFFAAFVSLREMLSPRAPPLRRAGTILI
jgi:hypothetical protein